jgi:hypothetical protein
MRMASSCVRRLLLVPCEAEVGGHYTRNGVAPLVQIDRFAEDPRVGTVSLLPQTMTDDSDLVMAGLHLVGRKKTAHERLYAEHRQQIDGSLNSSDALRPITFGNVESRPTVVAHPLENLRLLCDVGHVGCGHARLHVAISRLVPPLPEPHQLLRAWVGQGAKDDRIHEAENGGVSADTERQREDCDGGKTRAAHDLAEAEAKITAQVLDPHKAVHLHNPPRESK